MSRIRSRLADEQGLTLIELVITMSILSIIIIPLTASFMIGLLESNSTRDRVADAGAAQVISAWVMTDVQSSDAVATSGTCTPSAGGTNAVRLKVDWTDPSTGTPSSFGYVDHLPAGTTQHSLIRVNCANGSSSELAAYLDTTNGFTVLCDGTPTCSPTTKVVKVTIAAKSEAPSNQSSYKPYTFDFEVRRRVA